MLDNAVEVLKMFPNEMADPAVFRNGFKGSIIALVCGHGTMDGYIVYVGYNELGNLQLKDMHNIIVEYWYFVSPTHW